MQSTMNRAIAPAAANAPTLLWRTAISLIGVAGLAAATLMVAPPTFSAEPIASAHHHVRGETPQERAETVEQRIRTMHAGLHITTTQEGDWNGVAKAIRANATRMQSMITAREMEPEHHVTAPEDLRNHERFTQAHIDGLRMLRTAFDTLYATMPPRQQLQADEVFDTYGHDDD